MNSEGSQLLVSDDYESWYDMIMSDDYVGQMSCKTGFSISVVLGKDLCLWRRSAHAGRLPRSNRSCCTSVFPGQFYNYIFLIKCLWGRKAVSPKCSIYEKSFPTDPSAPPYSHLTLQPLSWFSWGLSAVTTCPVLCPGCFPSIPAVKWEGWCQPSPSLSAQKGSDAFQPRCSLQHSLAAGLCRSLLGFLKGKTCQPWEGGQHNDGNKPELERIARILRYLKCSRTRMI